MKTAHVGGRTPSFEIYRGGVSRLAQEGLALAFEPLEAFDSLEALEPFEPLEPLEPLSLAQ